MIQCCDISFPKVKCVGTDRINNMPLGGGKFVFDIQKNSQTYIDFSITKTGDYDIVIHAQSHVDIVVKLIVLFVENVTINLHIIACGSSAKINVLGMYALHAFNNLKIYSLQEHKGVGSSTDVNFAGMLSDAAHILYDGMIRINSSARQTYANLQNKNIVMSPQTRVISVPNIEVLNNDVQCFHGSAVGRFNDIIQWYMYSRGLSKLQVKKMLIQGLFAEVLDGHAKKNDVIKLICEKLS